MRVWKQETYLCIRVVGGLETQILKTHVGKEVTEETLEAFKSQSGKIDANRNGRKRTTQCQTEIGNDTLNLVELSQMCCVDRFITEDTIDGEVACWSRVFC